MSIEFPRDAQPTPGVPQFDDYQEELEWRFEKVAESIKNLATRSQTVEQFLQKGPDMIQYKPPGEEKHLNLTELFDLLFERLNKIEEDLSQLKSEHIHN